ncbi:VirD4-like conjugal transfer protein, CD1115 family [Bifidobacterium catulorum]|uniref:Uncharacterized protein n=1 Tax=Bifidobacterium catulorum TaxID=1630173 RepID=A0A2U2MUV6_9BIFI|nr:type IV secretory system conjugative DNA transfer family protein [Bifidobacterium catulorum]PWG60604.1 hypothetical protein DF200_01630 [Bifidobacterium catulorum]
MTTIFSAAGTTTGNTVPMPTTPLPPAPMPAAVLTGGRILADGVTVGNDTHTTGLNNNDVVIGASGTGKTRGYVLPNLLQCEGSMIVADTKGGLYHRVGPLLESQGYEVQLLDFTDMEFSPYGYNPMSFIRRDEMSGGPNGMDVMALTAALAPDELGGDVFWDRAARMQLSALVGYVMEAMPEDERDLHAVTHLLVNHTLRELNAMFEALLDDNPRSFALLKWRMSTLCFGADRMQSSIMGIMAEKLDCYSYTGPYALFTNPRQVDFARMGERRTALFLNISDTDRSQDRLVNALYMQALQTLCRTADAAPGGRLAVPVRIILDDFAANATIPDFDKVISVIRSREIAVSIILQSVSQLEAMYGPARARTILNNCDHCLYLGGQDVATSRYVATKAGTTVNAVLDMPVGDAYLFTRGSRPRQVRMTRPESHPRYAAMLGAMRRHGPDNASMFDADILGDTGRTDRPSPRHPSGQSFA